MRECLGYEPGRQRLSGSEKTLQGGGRGSQAIHKFATKGASSLNIKDYCGVRKIGYHVQEFSILCMGRFNRWAH